MLYAVIMAGGSGTRFWPLSRRNTPKHMLTIVSEKPLIAECVDRFEGSIPPERTLVVTTAEQVGAIRGLLPQIPEENIIVEPVGRDTAACIGFAACVVHHRDPDAVMAVLPSDHVISPASRLVESLAAAEQTALERDGLVTFGIRPSWPHTGMGYIHRGEQLDTVNRFRVFRLRRFREKPNLDLAQQFIDTGEYYWNSGIFVWKVATILGEIEKYMPEHHELLSGIAAALGTPDEQKVVEETYPRFQRISIDFGVMEMSRTVYVIEADYDWDDVGSWTAIPKHHPMDLHGNTVLADFESVGTSDCIIVGQRGHLVTAVGVQKLVIVHTADATLVCSRDAAGDVKKLVEHLQKIGHTDVL
ncbi:MAG TPA: mannose-1-phosphate guanylyltransferase [Planctomycetota bacterium]|nr:mannose-1-phosphate guanylyltransferase [Planctomycetota bacterium]